MKMADKDKIREEYGSGDLGKGTRGKYYADYRQDANIVVLDPDVARAFPDSRSVNQALRKYLQEHPDDVSGES
jgi:hypothetical protein